MGFRAAAGLRTSSTRAADDDPEVTAGEMITAEADKAIEAGLQFLAGRQQPDGFVRGGGYSRDVAVAALAGMAFMAGGSTPGEVRTVTKSKTASSNLADNTQDSGYINAAGSGSHGPMYGHGFATLFLAETYGMTAAAPTFATSWPVPSPDLHHAKRRRRLAQSADQKRSRSLGDDLPNHGAAGREERRAATCPPKSPTSASTT